ncbi:MAG: polynucleotide adenylyltransferase PcnB [Planctomycetota bacterium]|nr:polynucleotide adenylyltransferase PcnB [Planctomycetota bacterium]
MAKLDQDAVRATQRLNSRGYEAYLVGGCVRDLFLDRVPKDYDIATGARPQQVKRSFPRNCRIIGRRFKLAHLHFHDNNKILEVSTFRRSPQIGEGEDDLLITRDNEFGTAEEDALRRDFTVNALFLDPTRDCILDYANGLEDLRARTIRTIGDPLVRFREDPVRMLRAAKFAGRLNFSIEPKTLAAMAEAAPDLVRSAPPRVLEEILRLLRGGHALDSFQLLRDVGALKSLLPIVGDFLGSAPQKDRVNFWRLLEVLDHRVSEGWEPSNAVLLGTLFTSPVSALLAQQPRRSPSTLAEELLGPLSQTLRLPRRDAGCLKRICGVQHRFEPGATQKRYRASTLLRSPYFPEALDLFELRATAEGLDQELVEQWRDRARGEQEQEPETEDSAPTKRPRRRRRTRANADEDAPDAAEEQVEDEEATDTSDDAPRTRRKAAKSRRRRRKASSATDEASTDEAPAEGEENAAVAEADPDTDEATANDDEAPARRRRRRRRRSKADPASSERKSQEEGRDEEATDTDDQDEAGTESTDRPKRKRRRRSKKATGKEAGEEASEGGRKKRSKRGGNRKGSSKKGGNRQHGRPGLGDVDVVPRYRDRRGKVEVIEPEPMDVSAFNVELDPKRVPTFGSIVEGKRPSKRRSPRLPDKGKDDYKPPPPPAKNGPDTPPPDTDSFGDW